jgi:hypothetical protein
MYVVVLNPPCVIHVNFVIGVFSAVLCILMDFCKYRFLLLSYLVPSRVGNSIVFTKRYNVQYIII